jgi:hypothetical protein
LPYLILPIGKGIIPSILEIKTIYSFYSLKSALN